MVDEPALGASPISLSHFAAPGPAAGQFCLPPCFPAAFTTVCGLALFACEQVELPAAKPRKLPALAVEPEGAGAAHVVAHVLPAAKPRKLPASAVLPVGEGIAHAVMHVLPAARPRRLPASAVVLPEVDVGHPPVQVLPAASPRKLPASAVVVAGDGEPHASTAAAVTLVVVVRLLPRAPAADGCTKFAEGNDDDDPQAHRVAMATPSATAEITFTMNSLKRHTSWRQHNQDQTGHRDAPRAPKAPQGETSVDDTAGLQSWR